LTNSAFSWKLSARVRVLSSGNARKNDGVDALATALAASRNDRRAAVDPEDSSEVLRLLSEGRENLVAERTLPHAHVYANILSAGASAAWPSVARETFLRPAGCGAA
jgi:hypothetical protein